MGVYIYITHTLIKFSLLHCEKKSWEESELRNSPLFSSDSFLPVFSSIFKKGKNNLSQFSTLATFLLSLIFSLYKLSKPKSLESKSNIFLLKCLVRIVFLHREYSVFQTYLLLMYLSLFSELEFETFDFNCTTIHKLVEQVLSDESVIIVN